MKEFTINKKQAREFVFECFESIINDIKAKGNKALKDNISQELYNEITESVNGSK